MNPISRRSFMLAGLGAALIAVPGLAQNTGFSEIQVDMSALENGKYGVHVEWVRTDLSRALAQLFPNRAGRSAPRLIVVPTDLSLGDYADAHDPGTDYLYGDAMIVAPDRTVLNSIPIKLSLPPQEAGRWDRPDIDRLRVTSLCNAFAGWVARYVNR